MPRYFTSPPPVYARNWANGQNLVESTKIERQIVTSKKVHTKEKKEKKKPKIEKSLKEQYYPTKQISDESEQLEKSCLTEEPEQYHSVGYLSDGSQNSKKRRREASPAVESNVKATPVAGNPLRIRFVFKKPKEAEVVPHEDQVCSTSGAERPVEVSTSKSCDLDENLLVASRESEKTESKKRKKHKPSKESRYNTLFDELVPPCFPLEDGSNSDDWLFGTKRQDNATTKCTRKNDEDKTLNLQITGNSFLPTARILSEVEIFALPYTTVLF